MIPLTFHVPASAPTKNKMIIGVKIFLMFKNGVNNL